MDVYINSALCRSLFATGFCLIEWVLVIDLGYTYYNNSFINRTAASILRVIF